MIKSCADCQYRRYLGEGKSLCIHALAQIKLMDHPKKSPLFKHSRDHISDCTYHDSGVQDPKLIGFVSERAMEKARAIENIKDAMSQGSLFG